MDEVLLDTLCREYMAFNLEVGDEDDIVTLYELYHDFNTWLGRAHRYVKFPSLTDFEEGIAYIFEGKSTDRKYTGIKIRKKD